MTASIRIALLLALVVYAPSELEARGLFRVTGVLDSSGKVDLQVIYAVDAVGLRKFNYDKELGGAPFTLKKFGTAKILEATFDDVESLGRLPLIASEELTSPQIERQNGLTTLRLDMRPVKRVALKRRLAGQPDDRVGLRMRLTFPGEIVRTNATTVDGRTAVWLLTLLDFWNLKEPIFEVVFEWDDPTAAVSAPIEVGPTPPATESAP